MRDAERTATLLPLLINSCGNTNLHLVLNSPRQEDPLGEPVPLGSVDSDRRRSARGGCQGTRGPPPWKRGNLPTGARAGVAPQRPCCLVWNTRPA